MSGWTPEQKRELLAWLSGIMLGAVLTCLLLMSTGAIHDLVHGGHP